MNKILEHRPVSVLIPVIEEISLVSETEREALRASITRAHADIAAGDYDVVTSETLRTEFNGIFHHNKSDADLDVTLGVSPRR